MSDLLTVFTTEAGPGLVQASVKGPGGRHPFELSEGAGVTELSFVPNRTGTYYINVTFNDEVLPTCPHTVEVYTTSDVAFDWSKLGNCIIHTPASFNVDTRGFPAEQLDINVRDSYGGSVAVERRTAGARLTAWLQPQTVGPHRVNVMFKGESLNGCPHEFLVFDPCRVIVDVNPEHPQRDAHVTVLGRL